MTPVFNLPLARRLALASQRAYSGTAIISDPACHVTISDYVDEGDTVIACRGTASIIDLITDARALRLQFPDWPGSVHAGFGHSLSVPDPQTCQWTSAPLIARIVSILTKSTLENPNQPRRQLYITGHSLGGAQAVLIASRLMALGIPITGIYTFGQPRVGNGSFCRAFKSALRAHSSALFRVVHEDDVIARIPGLLAGYRHVGTEEFLSAWPMPMSSYEITENPKLWFKLLSCAWDLWSARRRGPLALTEFLADHAIDKYVTRLQLV